MVTSRAIAFQATTGRALINIWARHRAVEGKTYREYWLHTINPYTRKGHARLYVASSPDPGVFVQGVVWAGGSAPRVHTRWCGVVCWRGVLVGRGVAWRGVAPYRGSSA